jgi:16S rRNA (cytosine967-C5)-methyltransferase
MRDPTRESAFDLLTAVLERHRPLEEALDALPPQAARDRAAAHRLAASVLRRMGTLDAVLEPHLRKQPPEPVRIVLRIGAAGLLLLQTPGHAAVATAVALAKARGLTPFAGLVNAVLRKIATAGTAVLEELDQPRLDTPAWLWTSWGSAARAIATAHQTEAPLDVTLKQGAAIPGLNNEFLEAISSSATTLQGESGHRGETPLFELAENARSADAPGSAQAPGGRWLPTGSLRFPAGTPVTTIAGFDSGDLWVQDAAAALPARLLAVRPGERVADLCAAPGGKTGQLAAAGATVTALDRDPVRLERLSGNLKKWQLHADVICADATEWVPLSLFDAILLDAPCSATGTIRRHPDVLRLKRPRDVQALVETQDKLLAAALALLRPGGRLIYVVCSLQPEEGPARIAAALDRAGSSISVKHDPFTREELAALPEALTSDGFLRTHPGLWSDLGGMDGFFAARLIRT